MSPKRLLSLPLPLLSRPPGREDIARLEAFLAACPLEYCGFAADGALAYSPGFAALLSRDALRGFDDLAGALRAADAAALEGLYERLRAEGTGFSLTVRTAADARQIEITGRRGQGYDILWARDVSASARDQDVAAQARQNAEDERNRLQKTLDQLPLPLWLRDERTDISWCNRAYAQALEASPASVIAEQRELSFKGLKKGNALLKLPGRALAQEALERKETVSTEAHIIAGGQRKRMLVSEVPRAGGGTLGLAQDVTRTEELENELKRYTAAYKELLEQLGTAIGLFNADQVLEFYNSAFAQLWDLEDQYLNTRPRLGDMMEKLREMRRLPEQADFRKFKNGWLNMFTGLIGPHEDMLYLPSGAALRMLAVPHPMGGLMLTFEDVTSRLELESSYNTLIAVQKETLDNLSEGVAAFGGDGRLKLWNPSFASLWSLHPEDLDGQPHINRLVDKLKDGFTPAAWGDARETLVRQCLERNMREGEMARADGSKIAWSAMPLPDGGVLVTHTDITDKARVEAALREKNAALETAERLKLDFLANVSYQLRTPLNAIMGFAEILQHQYFGPMNARQQEYTGDIQEAGAKLVSLIDDILDLATIEAGYMTLNFNNVSIGDILHGLYDLTRDWAGKERINVRLVCPPDIGTLDADERRLKQVILNLIRNAIAFTPAGGTITLAAARNGKTVRLSVADTGPGIAPADRERIFQPFERAGSAPTGTSAAGSRTGTRGAGLGLTLVKTIAELHGGTVELDSAEERGTTVTLVLPAIRGHTQDKLKS